MPVEQGTCSDCEIIEPYYLESKIADITSVAKEYAATGAGAVFVHPSWPQSSHQQDIDTPWEQ